MAEPIHLQPTAPLAERVLLPGDPGRALRLAQHLLAEPRMFNHHRGLWGYSGTSRDDGRPLTIQSTGMGGPSAAIVVSELADLGARTFVRVGSCGALSPELVLGRLLVADSAICADGCARALGAEDRALPSSELTAALRGAGGAEAACGPVVSTDVFYETRPGTETGWAAAGALAVEMEAATLFALAARRGLAAAAVLIVSDLVLPERRRIAEATFRTAEHRAGGLAMAALATE